MRGFARLGDARRSSDERWRLCETKSQLARSDVKARLLSGVEICRARSIGAKIREARTQLRDELLANNDAIRWFPPEVGTGRRVERILRNVLPQSSFDVASKEVSNPSVLEGYGTVTFASWR